MLLYAQQLINDVNFLLGAKYGTKKAMAEVMALELNKSPESYYFFSKRTNRPDMVSKHFFRNFYTTFQPDLDALKGKVNIPIENLQFADPLVNNYAGLVQCIDNLTFIMERMVAVAEVILAKLNNRG